MRNKAEKVWLVLVVLFYVLYNLPGIPAYGDPKGAMIHAVLTVVPLWIIIYAGMNIIFKKFKLR